MCRQRGECGAWVVSNHLIKKAFIRETGCLREMIEVERVDIGLTGLAENGLDAANATWPDLLRILAVGEVTAVERVGFEWRWTVVGQDCDGRRLRLVTEIDEYARRVDVIDVSIVVSAMMKGGKT